MDLRELMDKLDFTEETLVQVLLEQAKLLMESSRYRIKKLKERLALEADFTRIQSEVSLRLRKEASDVKKTEAYIREIAASSPRVVRAKEKLDRAKALEEWGKLLVEAYHSRGSMAKALVQLISTEAAVESRFVKDELDRMGVSRLKRKVKSRFPGGDV